jgi:hypothetical protein
VKYVRHPQQLFNDWIFTKKTPGKKTMMEMEKMEA